MTRFSPIALFILLLTILIAGGASANDPIKWSAPMNAYPRQWTPTSPPPPQYHYPGYNYGYPGYGYGHGWYGGYGYPGYHGGGYAGYPPGGYGGYSGNPYYYGY